MKVVTAKKGTAAKAAAPAETGSASAATVTIAGVKGSFRVEYDQDETTVGALINSAAEQAGVPVTVENLAVVVNGEDAELGDAVENGANVAAAPKVRNGS